MEVNIDFQPDSAGESLLLQNQAAELKLRAERKAGGLLADMDLNKGTAAPGRSNTMLPRLEDLGITKIQSSRWLTRCGGQLSG